MKLWRVCVLALAATAATLGLRMALEGPLEGRPTLVLLTIPIMFCAYLGGVRAGLLATLLSFLGASVFLLTPLYSLAIASSADRWQLLILVAAGVYISVLNEALHRARRRAAGATREHQHAKDDRDRFFTLSQDMLCILGFDGYFKDVNPAWGATLGYTSSELLATPFITFVHPEDRQATLSEAENVSSGKVLMAFENRYRRKDGSYRSFQWSVTPVIDSGVMYGVARDITERQESQKALSLAHRTLEHRVLERTAQLEAANQELEAFSYSISHDLRAPLRAMDGFSQALLEDFGPQLPAEGQRQLHTIRGGAQKMGRLIDDLLSFSRLSRTPLKKQDINTGVLVRSVLQDLQPRREGRSIELRVGDLPACSGDPALLRQVWVNLLSNAFKYTQKREAAVVEIGYDAAPGANAYFVRDNGTGFDMRYADKLFGVFQRLHRSEEYEGTGVGLAIVQRVINRHGGRVWAQGAVDRGATFYFTLEADPKP